MGFISSFLGGGGGGSSQATTTTTNTTTNIRDIGLTGQNSVDIVNLLETGGAERERIAAGTLEKLTQQAGSNFNQLVGGAGQLVRTAGEVSSSNLASSEFVAGRNLETGENIIGQLIEGTRNLVNRAGNALTDATGAAERITQGAASNAESITATAVRGASVNPEAASAGVNAKLYLQIALIVGTVILVTRFK